MDTEINRNICEQQAVDNTVTTFIQGSVQCEKNTVHLWKLFCCINSIVFVFIFSCHGTKVMDGCIIIMALQMTRNLCDVDD